jgi:transposase
MLVSASLHRGHMDTSGIELPSRRTRRRHAPEFRDQVVQGCRQPGVSIAAVALANGLNANMVRKWVIDAEARSGQAPTSDPVRPAPTCDKPTPSAPLSFLPLALPAPVAPMPADEIRIELQRGATAIKVAWPATAAADCAAWLRELLK